jgi:hypothetical protein
LHKKVREQIGKGPTYSRAVTLLKDKRASAPEFWLLFISRGLDGGFRSVALKLNKDELKRRIADILWIVNLGRGVLRLSGLHRGILSFPAGEGKPDAAIGQKHGYRVGMAVHDGLLVWSIVNPQNPYLRILRLDFVVGRIGLHSILGERDGSETKTQYRAA